MARMMKLKSSDDQVFEVEEAVVFLSETLRGMVTELGSTDLVIPVLNVDSRVLSKVLEYGRYHAITAPGRPDHDDEPALAQKDVKAWDADFLRVDQATLFDLIMAANYLNIPSLLDLTCQAVAEMIQGKSPEQIRSTFGIKNDFTPEEEEEVRRENQWAFD